MNKIKKIGMAFIIGMSFLAFSGCESTQVVDELVSAEIITLPHINLDLVNNKRIEITDNLLNTWKSQVPTKASVIDALKAKIDVGGSVKHYLSQTIPTDTSDYFPITMEDIGTLYVIAEKVVSN